MTTYHAPQRDMRFVLHELLEVEQLSRLPGYEEATADVIDAVIEEGAKFCENVLFPINRTGDEQGCVYENGVVRTPEGFKEAYDRFVEGLDWPCGRSEARRPGPAQSDQDRHGRDGLLGESRVQQLSGSQRQRVSGDRGPRPRRAEGALSAKLAAGTWSGTMCLTEPQCGTDLGLIRTRAEPNDDGTYAITGTKIFITSGEQDLTANIVHLVLARLPDAPKGTRGISLFLVPKFLPKADGTPGPRTASCAPGSSTRWASTARRRAS